MSQRLERLKHIGGWTLAFLMPVGAAATLQARGSDSNGTDTTLRVVAHVNSAEVGRQGNGLKNVENILKAADVAGTACGDEVVRHSNGIALSEKATTAHAVPVKLLQKKVVRFAACENTMRQRSILPEDLLPTETTVPAGAFEVVRRQQDGYSYFKP